MDYLDQFSKIFHGANDQEKNNEELQETVEASEIVDSMTSKETAQSKLSEEGSNGLENSMKRLPLLSDDDDAHEETTEDNEDLQETIETCEEPVQVKADNEDNDAIEPKDCNQVDYTEQFASIQESINALQDVVENLQYNVSMLVQNQASAADVAVMRRENEAFRSDSNMKLMRKYGIDAMIKTYQAICDRLFRINHPRTNAPVDEGAKTAFEWTLKRMERQFKQLGILLKHTESGCEIDESVMVVYGSEGEDVEENETIFTTDVEKLKGTVKESVSPAFLWTVPSLIGDSKQWCMEPEKVCIYK